MIARVLFACALIFAEIATPAAAYEFDPATGQQIVQCPACATTASVGGFAPGAGPGAIGTALSVSNVSSNVALPTGATIEVDNVGSNGAFVFLGGNSVAATTAELYIPAGGTKWFTVGTNGYLAGITSSSTTTLNITGGSGLGAGSGGGLSGGSSSNASVGTTASAVPGSATFIGGKNGSGNLTGALIDANGAFEVSLPAVTGTAGSPASGVLSIQGVASGTAVQVNLNQVGGSSYALGSAASVASMPVVIASDQAAVTVKQGTASALNATVVGTGTFAVQAALTGTLPGFAATPTVNAAQSGTWTVQPGNTPNTTPWLFSPSTGGNTAAVKAASTAAGATDPALVVAVSPNNSVTVIQPTGTNLHIVCDSGCSGGGGGGAITAASGSYAAGAFSVGAGVDGWNITEGTKGDTACASSSSTCSIDAALKGILGAAQNPLAAQSGVVDIGATSPYSAASGGATGSTILSAASNNSTSIKASAGTLYSVTFLQTTTTLMDIRFYDTASAPTCSSATGMKLNFVVQSNTVTPGASFNLGPTGIAFTTGIGVCITGANANNDNTNAVTGLNLITAYN